MMKLFMAVGVIVLFLVMTSASSIANDSISWRIGKKEKLSKVDDTGGYRIKKRLLSFLVFLQGPQGEQGPPGADGKDGQTGPEGPTGPAGQDGKDGTPGIDGKDGMDGKDGIFTNGSHVYRNVEGHLIMP
ncbi:MAG: collagen-like protein [bacterium]|nr:collagen-like protein [bacterium]